MKTKLLGVAAFYFLMMGQAVKADLYTYEIGAGLNRLICCTTVRGTVTVDGATETFTAVNLHAEITMFGGVLDTADFTTAPTMVYAFGGTTTWQLLFDTEGYRLDFRINALHPINTPGTIFEGVPSFYDTARLSEIPFIFGENPFFASGSVGGLLVPAPIPIPSPTVGTGLSGLMLASGGLLAWWRRRRA